MDCCLEVRGDSVDTYWVAGYWMPKLGFELTFRIFKIVN
jgi:hypothetical protein